MNSSAKNKLLIWLLLLLLAANSVSIAMFWLWKERKLSTPRGTPKEFLIKELKLDTKQQAGLEILVKEHRQAAEQIRRKIKEAKESFFDLLKDANIADSAKQAAAKTISISTEELDLLTLTHFQKVRNLCTPEQQKKFDEIIHQVTSMIRQAPPPQGRPGGDRPPAVPPQ